MVWHQYGNMGCRVSKGGLQIDERDDLEDPERDVASRLEEMKSQEWIPIIT